MFQTPKKVFQELTAAKTKKEKLKSIYRYISFRWSWLYPLYYVQMAKRMQKAEEFSSESISNC